MEWQQSSGHYSSVRGSSALVVQAPPVHSGITSPESSFGQCFMDSSDHLVVAVDVHPLESVVEAAPENVSTPILSSVTYGTVAVWILAGEHAVFAFVVGQDPVLEPLGILALFVGD